MLFKLTTQTTLKFQLGEDIIQKPHFPHSITKIMALTVCLATAVTALSQDMITIKLEAGPFHKSQGLLRSKLTN